MIKFTSTKSGMRIVTVKAFGIYTNVSYGKCAKRSTKADTVRWYALPAMAYDGFGMAACAVLAFTAYLSF